MDFSNLTNDQLLQLLRAACAEASNRGTAVASAAHEIVIDSVEQAKIERDALKSVDAAAVMAEKIRIAKQAVADAVPYAQSIDAHTRSMIERLAVQNADAEAKRKLGAEALALAERKAKQERDNAESLKQREAQLRLWSKKRDLALAVLAGFPNLDVDKPIQISIWKNVITSERRVYIQGGKDTSSRYCRSHEIDICYYMDGCDKHAPGSITGTKNHDKPRLIAACKKCISGWSACKIDVRQAAEYQETINA